MESAIVLNIKRVSWHNKGSLKNTEFNRIIFQQQKKYQTQIETGPGAIGLRWVLGFIHSSVSVWWILAPKLADLVAGDLFVSCFLIFLETFSSSIFVCRKKRLVVFQLHNLQRFENDSLGLGGEQLQRYQMGRYEFTTISLASPWYLIVQFCQVFAKIYEDKRPKDISSLVSGYTLWGSKTVESIDSRSCSSSSILEYDPLGN